jgi:hypothetical protein
MEEVVDSKTRQDPSQKTNTRQPVLGPKAVMVVSFRGGGRSTHFLDRAFAQTAPGHPELGHTLFEHDFVLPDKFDELETDIENGLRVTATNPNSKPFNAVIATRFLPEIKVVIDKPTETEARLRNETTVRCQLGEDKEFIFETTGSISLCARTLSLFLAIANLKQELLYKITPDETEGLIVYLPDRKRPAYAFSLITNHHRKIISLVPPSSQEALYQKPLSALRIQEPK